MKASVVPGLVTVGLLTACGLFTSPDSIRPHDLELLAEQPSVGGGPHFWCVVVLRFDAPDQLPAPFSAVATGLVMRRVLTPTTETLKSTQLDSVHVQVARVGSDTLIYLTGSYADTLNISGSNPSWSCTEKVPFAQDPTLKGAGYPDPWTVLGRIRYTLAPTPL
jgi:hypothetical protein